MQAKSLKSVEARRLEFIIKKRRCLKIVAANINSLIKAAVIRKVKE
jgi:hypothetical protein